jgi:hypothetical protein
MKNTAIPVIVRHISKNVVTICASEEYSITLFKLKDGNVEAALAANDGSETIRLLIAGPTSSQTISIETHKPTGVVTIKYEERRNEKV